MLGYISSVHQQKRYGFIKENGKNFTYFFGFNSVIDKDLKPKVGTEVYFELYRKNENEQVAVRIRSSFEPTNGKMNKLSSTQSSESSNAKPNESSSLKSNGSVSDKSKNKSSSNDEFVNAVVLWFNRNKKYGYVQCENSEDAFIHSNILLKAGVEAVEPNQKLKVKLVENKYPGKKAVCDVILLNGSRRNPKMTFPRPPKYPPVNTVYSSNDLTTIPSSTAADNMRRPNSTNSVNAPSQHSALPSGMMPFHGPARPPPFYPVAHGPPFQPIPFNRPPTPRMLFERPRMSTSEACYDSRSYPSKIPSYPAHIFNGPPMGQPNGDGPFNGPSRTPVRPMRMSRPSTPDSRINSLCYDSTYGSHRQKFSPRNSSQKSRPPITNPEYAKIKQQISQKENLLKTINVSKLPDAGQRLRNQIKDLKAKMKNLSIHSETVVETEVVKPKSTMIKFEPPPDIPCHVMYDTSIYSKYYHSRHPKSDSLGGSSLNLPDAQKVTSEAIEKLHNTLNTCPPSTKELPDPEGLQITLMPHQRQALTWMVWREEQSISGGILADDMGLGKTLTMIALILMQILSNEEKIVKTESSMKVKSHSSDTTSNEESDTEESDEDDDSKKEIDCDSTLIIAPASLIYHWENEIRNRCQKGLLSIHLFHGSDREKVPEKLSEFDVVITTYDIVRRTNSKISSKSSPKSHGAKEDVLFQINWRRIILDESHQIRNHKSQTSEAVCSLHAKSRWAVSGTPIQNDENDMYAMIKFLHCDPFDQLKLWKSQVGNKTSNGQKRLKTLVSCFVLRREKSQKTPEGKPLVALPKRTFHNNKLKFNEIELEVYAKLKEESYSAYKAYQKIKKNKEIPEDRNPYSRNYSSPKEKMSATSLLVRLLRLRQCCSHLHLLKGIFDVDLLEKEREQVAVEDLLESLTLKEEEKDESFKAEQYVGKDKMSSFEISAKSSKVEFVLNALHKLNFEKPSDKSVIVSQWTSMLRIMAHHLDKEKLSYAIIEGGVPARKRMSLVDEFNRNPVKPKIMLVSLQAGGVGLNLIGGNHLFLLDLHWNPALEKQAFDRIYRVGQTKEVFVHKLILESTVEEQILRLQQEKILVADSIMAGADAESKVKLTLSDMKTLFGI